MIKPSLCCISLTGQDSGRKFQTMTYKRFSSMPRQDALQILGDRILNNIDVATYCVRFCDAQGWDYRFSSALFPLITYDMAQVAIDDLPNIEKIDEAFSRLSWVIQVRPGLRLSSHPDQFVVLASENADAVEKSIKELNFQSWFFDRLNLPASHDAPINLHIQNKKGATQFVIDRFLRSFERLDPNCQKRLVVENDDKTKMWSVRELVDYFHPATKIPITFDYLHHKCHPDGLTEEEAFHRCYETWDVKPWFHYSESKDEKNIRSHADNVINKINDYGKDFTCDFEVKNKDLAILRYLQNVISVVE